jgi:hypothetical protein
MSEKLDRILEYCDLEGRLLHGTGLSSSERARLERLRDTLSTQVPSLDERDSYTLLSVALPAQVITGSAVVTGQLRNASAVGVALSVDAPPPSLSQRAKVVVRDVERGLEYVFAGIVVSRVVKGGYGMAVQLDTTPSKLRLGGRSGVYPRGGVTSESEARTTVRPQPEPEVVRGRVTTKKG